MQITTQQRQAVAMLVKAVVDTVNETPEGAPGGIMYAALMAHGCSLSQFESLMAALVRLGKIRKQGDCYYPV